VSKVASVVLGWNRSPSTDVVSQSINITINGNTDTSIEVGAEVQSYQLEVDAKSSVSFAIKSFDSEGKVATSEVYSFTLGDLEAPLPATNLFHEIVGIREVAPEVVLDI
jgi:hypothetical protein